MENTTTTAKYKPSSVFISISFASSFTEFIVRLYNLFGLSRFACDRFICASNFLSARLPARATIFSDSILNGSREGKRIANERKTKCDMLLRALKKHSPQRRVIFSREFVENLLDLFRDSIIAHYFQKFLKTVLFIFRIKYNCLIILSVADGEFVCIVLTYL